MKIETKFDVGTWVWLVWESLGNIGYQEEFIDRVTAEIAISDDDISKNVCRLLYWSLGEPLVESNLFLTRAAAEAEIARRKA